MIDLPGPINWHALPDDAVTRCAQLVAVTTTHAIPNSEIVEILDVITAEAALGMHIFKDLANVFRDTFGGRSASLQGTLREARIACLGDLRREALVMGADAVVGVSLDYSEFTSSAVRGGMVFVVGSGTAVRLSVPIPREKLSAAASPATLLIAQRADDHITGQGLIGNRKYLKLASGAVEMDTLKGRMRFGSLDELREYVGE